MEAIDFDKLFDKLPKDVKTSKCTTMIESLVTSRIPLLETNSLRADFTIAASALTLGYRPIRSEDPMKKPFELFVEKVDNRYVMKITSAIDIVRDIHCEIPHHVEINGTPIVGKRFMTTPFGENKITIVFEMSEVVPQEFDVELDCSLINSELWRLVSSTPRSLVFGDYTYTK